MRDTKPKLLPGQTFTEALTQAIEDCSRAFVEMEEEWERERAKRRAKAPPVDRRKHAGR